MISAVSVSPLTAVKFLLVFSIETGSIVCRIKANICHVPFSKANFNMVMTLKYSTMLQKPSYLKRVSKTVKYRIHVLELNLQSQKEKKGLRRSIMIYIFSEKSVLHIGDLQDLAISEDLQNNRMENTKMSVSL